MKIVSKIFLLIAFFSLFKNVAIAQDLKINFERIGKEHGLIPGNVNDILQDKTGFLWMATENGLCKYDGYNFEYYRYQVNDSNSLSYNHVFSLLEDKDGIIWVGTLGGGLNKFSSKTGKFKRFMFDPSKQNSISSNIVFKVFKDSKNRIWVSTLGGGLNLFDPVNETFIRFQHSKEDLNSISSDMVSDVYEDKQGKIWLGTFDAGMNLYDEPNKKFIRFKNNPSDKNSLSHNQVMEFLEDEYGRFWVATFGGGINLFDRKSGKFSNIKNNPVFIMNPNNPNVRKMKEDDESIWVGTYNGLYRFDKKTLKKIEIFSNPNDPKTINDNKIRSIFKDRTGVVWIGTIVGVNKFDSMQKKFQLIYFNENYKKNLDNLHTVPDKYIAENTIWAGPGKLRITKSNFRNISFYGRVNSQIGFQTKLTSNFYIDEQNYIWVGSYNGIHYYDNKDKEFHNVQYFDDGTPTQGNNFVRWFYIDKQNRFWAGTMVGGLNYFDPQKKVYKKFIHEESDINSLGDSRVSCVLQDNDGKIWIGTYGGLDVYNETNGTFSHYRVIPDKSDCISNDRVYSLYESKAGELWVGTYQGLNRYNKKKNNFEQFKTAHGLSDNTIYSIQEDKSGNLWIRTNDGISKFDPTKKIFKNFNTNDGLPGMELNGNISLVNNDGKMFFGFSNGLVSFYPEAIKDNPFKPTLAFTKLTIMDEEVKIGEGSPLKKPLNELDEVVLSYTDKIIGIEFSALHYAIPSKNKYAYKLEGVLDKWITVDAGTRMAKFTNLNPGEYTLKVKATNNDGIWTDVERSLKIIITPPFWETWWFRLIMFAAFLLVVFMIYEIRLNKLLEIEHTRSKIARNLHDEVGGTLSSIQYFVRAIEKEMDANNRAGATKYLNLILESSSIAQDSIRDLIWTVNPEEDGLLKFLVKFRRYTSDLLDSKEIHYNILLPTGNLNQSISMEKRQHLWCICKETITNIVKHSKCNNVNIKFDYDGKALDMTIEDDGVGFDQNEKQFSNGLVNIKNRADALKANYSLNTATNKGTHWNFSIKI